MNNAQTARAFISNKEAEIKADRQARIEELKNQRAVLVAKLDATNAELEGIENGSIEEASTNVVTRAEDMISALFKVGKQAENTQKQSLALAQIVYFPQLN